MSDKSRMITGLVFGVLSFLMCFCAGVWLLFHGASNDPLGTALGLYFIGKSFFVGPVLVLSSAPATGNNRPVQSKSVSIPAASA
jgi:hypothetical protein